MVRRITKWGIKFLDEGRRGKYYVSGNKKVMQKEISDLRKNMPKVKWSLYKFQANAWVPRK